MAGRVQSRCSCVAVRRQEYGMGDQFQRQFRHPTWKRVEEEDAEWAFDSGAAR
jgi:hypothetical protein